MTERRASLLLLAVAGALMLSGCARFGETAPAEVSLAVLVEDHDRYEGRVVVTEGVVQTFDDPRHYWIEDEALNRVEVVPHEAVEPHVGDVVRVVGRFTFDEQEGRRITADEVEPLGETPRAAGGDHHAPIARRVGASHTRAMHLGVGELRTEQREGQAVHG